MFSRFPLRWLSGCALAAALPLLAQQDGAASPREPIPIAEMLPVELPPFALPAQQPAQVSFVPQPREATPQDVGDALEARRHYQAALDAYRKVQPPTAVVWNRMGIAYQMLFDLKDATRCYLAAVRLDRGNASYYNNLGTVYDSQKNYRKAEKNYRKALDIHPESPTVLKNLGTNLLMQRKYTQGWDAYTRALALDPNIFMDQASPQVQSPSSVKERGALNYYMARGCLRTGQTACALQYLRLALDEGFVTPRKLLEDQDFFLLHANPDFQQLLAAEQKKPPQSR
jgi:tetratricopeptide (TPR) repeat protein